MPYRSFQSLNYPDRFIRHRNYHGELSPIHSNLDKWDATFDWVWVDESRNLVRLRSFNFPNHYLRHQNFRIMLHKDNPADSLMQADSTFILTPGLGDPFSSNVSFRASNFPEHYIRHRDFHLYLDFIRPNDQLGRKDATFRVTNPWIMYVE